ncbi:uncharacterized protein LOC143880298 isoform X2 [Tasmannia lanceolata]
MDKAVIELLTYQVAVGNKIDKGFKAKAYASVGRELTARFGKKIHSDHIQNRLRTIKKQYQILKAMVNNNGFTWDPVMKIITAEEQVWKEYLEAHPDAEPYKGKRVELYEEMCVVVGNDQPNGSMAKAVIELDSKDPIEDTPNFFKPPIELDGEEALEGIESSSKSKRGATSSTASQGKQKKPRTTDDMVEMMALIVSNMEKIAKAMIPNSDYEAASDLYMQVRKLEGYSDEDIDDIFDILNGDDKLARSFMAKGEQSRRRMADKLLHQHVYSSLNHQ